MLVRRYIGRQPTGGEAVFFAQQGGKARFGRRPVGLGCVAVLLEVAVDGPAKRREADDQRPERNGFEGPPRPLIERVLRELAFDILPQPSVDIVREPVGGTPSDPGNFAVFTHRLTPVC